MKSVVLEALISKPCSQGNYRISLGGLHRFVALLWKIPAYQDSKSKKVLPLYLQELSDLNPDNSFLKRIFPGSHPFFRHLEYLQYFIAKKESFCVGRIAVYIDSHYKETDVDGKIGWIGLFECIESEEIAQMLIQKAVDTLKAQGVKKIIGPAKFNANGEIGLLIDGFEHHPMVMEPYHPPYYQSYFEKKGEKENDWFAFELNGASMESFVSRVEGFQKRNKTLNDKMVSKNIAIRTICFTKFYKDVSAIRALYNEAWDTSQHPQFEPFGEAEFRYIAKGLKVFAVKDWVLLAEKTSSSKSQLVAFSVMVPDLNEAIASVDQRCPLSQDPVLTPWKFIFRDLRVLKQTRHLQRNKLFQNARIFILASSVHSSGLDALLYLEAFKQARLHGLLRGSGSQVADINLPMVNPLKKMGKQTFTWRVYRFTL